MLDNCEFHNIQMEPYLNRSLELTTLVQIADYLIATIQMMIENHWGFSAVPLLFMAVFAEWKVIENIFTELKR